MTALLGHCTRLINSIEKSCSSRYKVSQEFIKAAEPDSLFESDATTQYGDYLRDLNSFYQKQDEVSQKVVLVVLKERVMQQVSAFLRDGTAGMESLCKQRNDIRLDFDSHLQKSGVYERKGDMDMAMRFHSKAMHDDAMLATFTNYLTNRLNEFVTLGTKLLLASSIAMVTCELYLVKQQYDMLCSVGTNLNDEDVFFLMSELGVLERRASAGEAIEKDYKVSAFELQPHPATEYPVYVPYDEFVKSGAQEKERFDAWDDVDIPVQPVPPGKKRVLPVHEDPSAHPETADSLDFMDMDTPEGGDLLTLSPDPVPRKATALPYSGTEGDLFFSKDDGIKGVQTDDSE